MTDVTADESPASCNATNTIAHLDFEPPCGARPSSRCPRPADTWVVRAPCCPTAPVSGFVCSPCLKAFLAGPPPRCPDCLCLWPTPAASLARIEPLR